MIYENHELENAERDKLKKYLEVNIFPCIFEESKKKERSINFHIYEVKELPYLFCSNGEILVVGPYFSSISNSKNLLFVLDADCSYGGPYESDFDSIIDKATENSWYDDYIKNNSNVKLQRKAINKGKYASKFWNEEETQKYIFSQNNNIMECGYYKHFKDSEFVKQVIELPTSCGCPMKCKYCASSSIEKIEPLTVKLMMELLDELYKQEVKDNFDKTLISMTGIGDLYFNFENVEKFLVESHKKYPKAYFSVSSCHWTEKMLSRIEALVKTVPIKTIQWTFISFESTDIASVIPFYNITSLNLKSIIDAIKISSVSSFRINYLMIDGINNSEAAFSNFISAFKDIKDKIDVRLSKLNRTHASEKNSLKSVRIEEMEQFKQLLESSGFSAYLFYSCEENNLNCGQLITENIISPR